MGINVAGYKGHPLRRRRLLEGLSLTPLAAACGTARPLATPPGTHGMRPRLVTDARALQAMWDAAVDGLSRNVEAISGFDRPVLTRGGDPLGLWLDSGPWEALLFAGFAPGIAPGSPPDVATDFAPGAALEVARASHEAFFALAHEDGYLPCWIQPTNRGAGRVQTTVPIAATALELFDRQPDEGFLRRAYAACGRWDAWLRKHRNTRGTGLVEAFCGSDTGQDDGPRFAGLPSECPEGDARLCPRVGNLPYLAPDLSASVYGGRMALARMARLLGRAGEEAEWLARADQIRQAIVKLCLDPVDVNFYDVDKNERYVRVKTETLTRVVGEHVPDDKLFAELWRRHLGAPEAFWTPYPFPSIAANDARFASKEPRSAWSGPSQALTALRALRWMEHYGKPAELAHVLGRWQSAIVAAGGFHQQLDPFTGGMSTASRYSPTMLLLLESVARLHGVRRIDATQGLTAPAGALEWTCGLPAGATHASYTLPTPTGIAELSQDAAGARLVLGGRALATVIGRARVRTDRDGRLMSVVGIGTASGVAPGAGTSSGAAAGVGTSSGVGSASGVAADAGAASGVVAVTVNGSDGKARSFTLAPNQVLLL